MRAADPDVLVLQEVSQGSILSGFHDNLRELADALGATSAVLVPNGAAQGGKLKGGAVLTFHGAQVQDARGLRHPIGSAAALATCPRRARAVDGRVIAGHRLDLPEWASNTYSPRTTTDVMITSQAGTACGSWASTTPAPIRHTTRAWIHAG